MLMIWQNVVIYIFFLFADDTTLIVDLDVYDKTIINRELQKNYHYGYS